MLMTLVLLKPRRFGDDRGWFTESWNRTRDEAVGITGDFCQDNHSYSRGVGTLRGIHFQRPPFAQAKLVRCVRGRIFDVAVDLRRASPTFGQWRAVELTAEHGEQLYVPAGYGHAFLTIEPECEVIYKVDAPYSAAADGGIAWNDATVGIVWPDSLSADGPILSAKDAALPGIDAIDFEFPYDGQPMTLTEASR
jgi:dTDP-4-dehydrorhamnose 3,5-epimerase